MACRLFGAKPLSEQMPPYFQLHSTKRHFSEIIIKNSKVFIQGNSLQNVVREMVGILSRPQYVNPTIKTKSMCVLYGVYLIRMLQLRTYHFQIAHTPAKEIQQQNTK